MAPFIDVNSDGAYNPIEGDYPAIKGSQMLWWVINDNGPRHDLSNTQPLGAEIRISAYAYKTGTVAENIIFYEYQVSNKSTSPYNAHRLGLFIDCDLGYAGDDYIGFDSSRRLGIAYNGKSIDGDGSPEHYGENLPMMGIAVMEMPGDAHGAYAPAGGFTYAVWSYPTTQPASNMYSLLQPVFPDGSKYFMNEHEECVYHASGDRNFILAANSNTFLPGETKKYSFALVAASKAGGCPYMNFSGIHDVTDTAYKLYWSPRKMTMPVTVTPTGLAHIIAPSVRLYPNPAKDVLHVDATGNKITGITVIDVVGRVVPLPIVKGAHGVELNTTTLSPGLYTLRLQCANSLINQRFVKE